MDTHTLKKGLVNGVTLISAFPAKLCQNVSFTFGQRKLVLYNLKSLFLVLLQQYEEIVISHRMIVSTPYPQLSIFLLC